MSEFIVNDDMFGLYARIPTGFSHERHIYKIIARIESNSYCDLPLGTCNTKQTRHGEIVPVLLVIHCGLDETEVVRIKEADCEIVNSHLREVAELTELLNASKAGQVSLQKAWEQDKADLTTRAEKAEANASRLINQMEEYKQKFNTALVRAEKAKAERDKLAEFIRWTDNNFNRYMPTEYVQRLRELGDNLPEPPQKGE